MNRRYASFDEFYRTTRDDALRCTGSWVANETLVTESDIDDIVQGIFRELFERWDSTYAQESREFLRNAVFWRIPRRITTLADQRRRQGQELRGRQQELADARFETRSAEDIHLGQAEAGAFLEHLRAEAHAIDLDGLTPKEKRRLRDRFRAWLRQQNSEGS